MLSGRRLETLDSRLADHYRGGGEVIVVNEAQLLRHEGRRPLSPLKAKVLRFLEEHSDEVFPYRDRHLAASLASRCPPLASPSGPFIEKGSSTSRRWTAGCTSGLDGLSPSLETVSA